MMFRRLATAILALIAAPSLSLSLAHPPIHGKTAFRESPGPWPSPAASALEGPTVRLVGREFVFNKPPFRQCHAPTIVECGEGRLLAAWFGGTQEGASDVAIWLSSLEGGRWTPPQKVADGISDGARRYPCWNPVLFRTKAGLLYLFYKVGPSPETWWGMMKRSPDDGRTWSEPLRLPQGFLGPVKNKPLELAGGTILCPASVEHGGTWKVHLEATSDGGRTWRKISPGGQEKFGLIQPTILTYPGGKLQLLCRSRENAVVSSWSGDGGETWGPFEKTGLPNPNSGIDATTLGSGLQVLVYNPTLRGGTWSHGRNKLSVAVSSDGRTWRGVYVLEDEIGGEYSYPAVIQTADGRVHIVYTWMRKNIRHVVLEIGPTAEAAGCH